MIRVLTDSSRRSTRPAFVTKLMTGTNAQMAADITFQRSVGAQVVSKRRAECGTRHDDLLDKMIYAKDPKTGRTMDDALINANMNTFLVAGHETTSSLLSFVMYNLLKSPEAYVAAQKEVDDIIGDSAINIAHLKRLKYINAVLRETLRLWPPAPAFSRTLKPHTKEEVILLGGYALPQGVPVMALLGKIQRDPVVYGDDAETFKPERMLDENFKKLPSNAWKPFGTGMRACIGRAFAWQEALLVVAMLLQRFDLHLENPAYDLNIQFNLTIKPKDLAIRATARHGMSPTDLELALNSGQPRKHVNRERAEPSAVASGPPMHIFYGSNTGTCQALAQRLAADAQGRGFTATTDPLDLASQCLPKSDPTVIVCSSFDGEPPDNARRFVESVKGYTREQAENVNYAVFGCGHRDWVNTFQCIPKLISETLEAAGAHQLAERGLSDVANGEVFDDFDSWRDQQLWSAISKSLNNDIPAAMMNFKSSQELDMDVSAGQRSSSLRQDVLEVEVAESKILTGIGEPEKRHCTFNLPERLSYQCGDYLAVLPVNSSDLVDEVMSHFKLSWDTNLFFKPGCPTILPTSRWISAREVLSGFVELNQPMTLKDLQRFRDLSTNPTDTSKLDTLLNSRGSPQTSSYPAPTALSLLQSHPSIPLPFHTFLSLLPPLRPRLYSISSSPLSDPTTASITYTVHNPPNIGTASTYLAQLVPGSKAAIAIRPGKPTFHLPSSLETTPLIMICAGTGLAPFRGFVQERAERIKEGGRDAGLAPALLFVGCRSRVGDRLYGAEFDEWERCGAVSLHYAFSREANLEESVASGYVQELVRREKEEVKDLWARGARIYVCGSNKVVGEVRAVLRDTVSEVLMEMGEDGSEEGVRSRLARMGGERFVVDNFG